MSRNGKTAAQPATAPIVEREGPLATGERFRPLALAGLTVVLLILCVLLAVPLLPAITWGAALAVIAWPLHEWVTPVDTRVEAACCTVLRRARGIHDFRTVGVPHNN